MLVTHALASVRSCETFSLVILFSIFLVQEFSAETTQKQFFFVCVFLFLLTFTFLPNSFMFRNMFIASRL